jgi:hypothetical protein
MTIARVLSRVGARSTQPTRESGERKRLRTIRVCLVPMFAMSVVVAASASGGKARIQGVRENTRSSNLEIHKPLLLGAVVPRQHRQLGSGTALGGGTLGQNDHQTQRQSVY